MKFIAVILALILVGLAGTPCTDGQNLEDQDQETLSVNHNHQDDSDDACPVTCVCSCCGMSITYQPLVTYHFNLPLSISSELISTYSSHYRFDSHTIIWQPPQVIS